MKNVKRRNAIDLFCNILDPVLVVIAVSLFFTPESESLFGFKGSMCFRFFTIDSNILAALSCLAVIPFNIRALKTGEDCIPLWAARFKFIGTDVVALTMLTVLFYLIPVQGIELMTASSNLYLHIICPPVVILSFILLEKCTLKKKDYLFGVATVFVYAVIYLMQVVVIGEAAGGWPDFYNFNDNNTWPFFFAGIMLFTYLVSRLVRRIKSKI